MSCRGSSKDDRLGERRMVVLDPAKCKPNMPAWVYFKKHQRECGKECITVTNTPDKKEIRIWDNACAACLNRAKRCPDNAAKLVKLPSNLDTNITHRYGTNAFKLHGLPMPRPGQVLGMLGCNGTGKSTALKILAGTLKPNLGRCDDPPQWVDIVKHYRGSELQNYFKMLLQGSLKVSIKPQIDQSYLGSLKGQRVGDLVTRADERGCAEQMLQDLDLLHLVDREAQELSGGEAQRLSIALAALADANVYMFDEASSFLDVRQRLAATRVIRGLAAEEARADDPKYVIVVEHDLAILDYMADLVHCLYGEPGCYGVIAKRAGLRSGINNFLAGYIPAGNMQFRSEALTFKVASASAAEIREMGLGANVDQAAKVGCRQYPAMTKTLVSVEDESKFTLRIEAGSFRDAEVIGLLGENGMGKTTYLRMLAGLHDAPGCAAGEAGQQGGGSLPVSLRGMGITVSYKRQDFAPKFRRYDRTVRELFERNLQAAFQDSLFKLFVLRPMRIEDLLDLNVSTLSGGELQRLAITMCLGTPAMAYLIDEPSAGLDCEQRAVAAKVIKRWVVSHLGRACFVIEHDCLMLSALADRLVLFSGRPGVEATAHSPCSVVDGFNSFLRSLDVTFRRDPANHRPRINKGGSLKDRLQKAAGNYYLLDDAEGEEEDEQ